MADMRTLLTVVLFVVALCASGSAGASYTLQVYSNTNCTAALATQVVQEGVCFELEAFSFLDTSYIVNMLGNTAFVSSYTDRSCSKTEGETLSVVEGACMAIFGGPFAVSWVQ